MRAKGPCLTRAQNEDIDAQVAQTRRQAAAKEKASYEDIVRRAVKNANKVYLTFEVMWKGLTMAPMYGAGAGPTTCGMGYNWSEYTVSGWKYEENGIYYVVLLKSDWKKAYNNTYPPVVVRALGVAGPKKMSVRAAKERTFRRSYVREGPLTIEHKRKLPHKEVEVNGEKYIVIEK